MAVFLKNPIFLKRFDVFPNGFPDDLASRDFLHTLCVSDFVFGNDPQ